MRLPAALEQLVAYLGRLPGVGEKSATRLALYLVGQIDSGFPNALGKSLLAVAERVHLCARCYNVAEGDLCPICADPTRDAALLCVVEGVPDLFAIESAHAFRGLYHVLHGVIAPLKGVGPDALRIPALVERARATGVREVIAATNADVEGEATAVYLAQKLRPLGIPVSRIATGIPMGSDLEFIDQLTLSRAIEGRKLL